MVKLKIVSNVKKNNYMVKHQYSRNVLNALKSVEVERKLTLRASDKLINLMQRFIGKIGTF